MIPAITVIPVFREMAAGGCPPQKHEREEETFEEAGGLNIAGHDCQCPIGVFAVVNRAIPLQDHAAGIDAEVLNVSNRSLIQMINADMTVNVDIIAFRFQGKRKT